MGLRLVVVASLLGLATSNYPVFDVNTQMRLLLLPADARIGSVIYRLRATDSDRDYPLIFAATDYGSYVIKIDNLPCNKNSSFCEANVFLERSVVPNQVFKFRITVRDTKGDTTTLPVSIKVTDGVTDFNEVFPHVPGVVMIPENTKIGTELEYVIVKKNPRAVRQANLELWGSKEFKFQQSSKKDTTTGLITLAAPLDYETKTMYKLSVFATGMWVDVAVDTRNIAGFQLVIVVTDVQDTPPIFDHIEPITTIKPNLTEGEVVLRVTARDGDKGSPRPIKYGLVSENNPFTVFFTIDHNTGDIRLARPLKDLRAISRSHQPILLTVIAEEQVTGTKQNLSDISTSATVALLLGQTGNSPPYFESPNYVTHVPENSVQGYTLVFRDPYVAEVRDDDMGKHGVFSLSLEHNNGTFEITPTVGERQANFIIRVRDNKLLDYEMRTELNFIILAKELNPDQKPLSSRVNVTVYITDENDNPPIYVQKNYSTQVSENATAGTYLVKVEATDVDTGDGGIIKYTAVLGMKNTSLSLDPDTGVLSIGTDSHGFDREESSSYQFFIEARDMKGTGNRATVPFTLFVLDVNDETPTFERDPMEFILGPDGLNFSQRAFIKAVDKDAEPPNNIVRYEIVSGNYDNKFRIIAETGELLVNLRGRVSRQAKQLISELTVRAYDLGVPTKWSTAQVRIFPADSGARVMRFLVSGRNPDRRQVQQLLSDLTGARIVIHSIEPYFSNQPFYQGKATDLTSGNPSGEKSIVTATIMYNNNAVVDLEDIQKRLSNNHTAQAIINDSVTVYRSETRTLFWILIILLLLIALAILTLLLCCCCECCPFYVFFQRFMRRKSAVQGENTINYMENREKENKSVQAEWVQSGRKEAWSADQPRRWHFNRRHSDNKILVMTERRQPNVIYTREVGSLQRHGQTDLIVEDVDGTEYRLLDPSRLSVHPHPPIDSMRRPPSREEEFIQREAEARPPTRDEKFIRDGNAEILRLITRGKDQEEDDGAPNINQPERPFTIENKEEENEGKVDIMRRFIEDASPEHKDESVQDNENGLMKRVMDIDDKELSTADVNRLTTIQRDLLLTRFLVEEQRRVRHLSFADDTQSLPGVVTMATQTDSHVQTQTDKSYFNKRKTKSDNDESISDSEENGRRRFKKSIKNRMREERVVEAFQQRSTEIQTPIIEEMEAVVETASASKGGQSFIETKASLLRHAATKVKLGIDDPDTVDEPAKPNQALYKMKSISDQDLHLISRHRENVIRSLQVTPIKQINITNNVLVEHISREEINPSSEETSSNFSKSPSRLRATQRKPRVASVPSNLTVNHPIKRQSSSEPRNPSRQSSKESIQRSSSQEKETAPRYMEWYKKKRELREMERKKRNEPEMTALNKKRQTKKKPPQKAPPVVEVDEEKIGVSRFQRGANAMFSTIEPVSQFVNTKNNENDLSNKAKQEEDRDSGIAIQYTIGPAMNSLRHQQALEKKSIFTIAYDDMETKQIRIDTASPT